MCCRNILFNYRDKPTFTNLFNNDDGNNGVNIMYQGCSDTKNLEDELKKSKQKLEMLKAKERAKRN